MSGQPAAGFEIHSAARGPHWVAWISRGGDQTPHESILLVGATRQEAEAKAQAWAGKVAAQMAGPPTS